MNCARTGVFPASTLLRLENYGKGEVVPALAISGDGATSDGDTVQGTNLEMGGWSGGMVSSATTFFKRIHCISLASSTVCSKFS